MDGYSGDDMREPDNDWVDHEEQVKEQARMTYQLKAITITKAQIVAAAQRIANKDDCAWESAPEQYLAAVENYLRCCVSDILSDADWYANKDNFTAGTKYDPSFVEEADDLIMPEAPAPWGHPAHDTIQAQGN